MMRIIVSEIPDEGMHIDARETIALPDNCGEAQPVAVQADILRDDPGVRIRGEIETAVAQLCSRCLAPVRSELRFDFALSFEPKGRDDEGHELRSDELEVAFFEANCIDFTEVIREQIMINLPMKPLCSEACGGICPQCGINRNDASCNCVVRETDERWNILNTILPERKA